MEIILYLSIILIILIIEIIDFIMQIVKKRKGLALFHEQWGKWEHETLLLEDVKYIRRRSEKKLLPEESEIDAITWNDLDMDALYQQMNYCATSSGDVELYRFLRYPFVEIKALNNRKKIMNMLKNNDVARNEIQEILARISRRSEIEWENAWSNSIDVNPAINNILASGLFVSLIASIFIPVFIPLVVILGVVNCIRASSIEKKVGPKSQTLLYMIHYVEALHTLNRSHMDQEVKDLFNIEQISNELSHIHNSLLENFMNGGGLIMLVVSQCFLGEAISYARLEKAMNDKKETIMKCVEILGKIDAAYAVVSFQQAHPTYCEALITSEVEVQAHGMIHPMLKHPVANDVILTNNLLISGSNASGKSTFLKMIALNAIFAQSFGFAFAADYKACFFNICTSMSLRDSIDDGDSYFISEIKAIKRILETSNKDVPKLCMIDEILRGTNTNERIAAASEILNCLCDKNTITLGATHDIELTNILSNKFTNVHFNETIKDNTMLFDYKLKQGPSDSRNAIALLKILGYDQEIIENADLRLSAFEKTGIWKKAVKA
ncbi:MAG: hypothetical protein RR863_00205 [Erysipelotrichaceae bacterium]